MSYILKYRNIFQVIGLTIFALSIAGIPMAQDMTAHVLFIVILVLTILAFLISLMVYCVTKKTSKSDYDVNKKQSKGGKDNKAFRAEEGKGNAEVKGAKKTGEKWVNNYVPFGDYPAGEVNQIATVESENEVKNGDPKWKKNYVPYQEENDQQKWGAL